MAYRQSLLSKRVMVNLPGKEEKPRRWPGLSLSWFFYCSWADKTNTPTLEDYFLLCYVLVTRFFGDWGA
jgi:hypothetical protein